MKKILYISLALITAACSKEVISNSEQGPPPHVKPSTWEDMIAYEANLDFRYDFVIHNPVDFDRNQESQILSRDASVRKWLVVASSAEFAKNYPAIKRKLSEWEKLNSDGSYAHIIQDVGLRYLRNYFLTQTESKARKEAAFLLDKLITAQARDLDVLVDALVFAQPTLTPAQYTQFLAYIRNCEQNNRELLGQKVPWLKEAYQKEKDPRKKGLIFINGKHFERMSLTCAYVDEVLGRN